MSTQQFHTRLRNGSTVTCIGNGREWKRKGMEGFRKGVCGLSMAKKSIHRFGSRGLDTNKRMGGCAAKSRGAR